VLGRAGRPRIRTSPRSRSPPCRWTVAADPSLAPWNRAQLRQVHRRQAEHTDPHRRRRGPPGPCATAGGTRPRGPRRPARRPGRLRGRPARESSRAATSSGTCSEARAEASSDRMRASSSGVISRSGSSVTGRSPPRWWGRVGSGALAAPVMGRSGRWIGFRRRRRPGCPPGCGARMGEQGGQPGPAPGAPALHGAGRALEDPGRLLHRVALHVDQDEGRLLVRGQPVEGGQQLSAQVGALGHRLRLGRSRPPRARPRGRRTPPCRRAASCTARTPGPSDPVQAGVDHDPVQPGRDPGVAPEGLGPAERGDHRVLERVGGVRGVAGRAQGDRPEPVAVPANRVPNASGRRRRAPPAARGRPRERPDPRRGPRSRRDRDLGDRPRNPPSTGGSEVSHTTR
jgi:hypothetical protein